MFHIIDNIFLSNLRDASNFELINKNKIEIVIRLSEDINKSIYSKNILFYNFEIEDNLLYKKEIIKFSMEIYEIINNNKDKNILIHCNEGQSRSVSVIIFYLMTKYKYNYGKCHSMIKDIKSDINPNMSFQQMLRMYHDTLGCEVTSQAPFRSTPTAEPLESMGPSRLDTLNTNNLNYIV